MITFFKTYLYDKIENFWKLTFFDKLFFCWNYFILFLFPKWRKVTSWKFFISSTKIIKLTDVNNNLFSYLPFTNQSDIEYAKSIISSYRNEGIYDTVITSDNSQTSGDIICDAWRWSSKYMVIKNLDQEETLPDSVLYGPTQFTIDDNVYGNIGVLVETVMPNYCYSYLKHKKYSNQNYSKFNNFFNVCVPIVENCYPPCSNNHETYKAFSLLMYALCVNNEPMLNKSYVCYKECLSAISSSGVQSLEDARTKNSSYSQMNLEALVLCSRLFNDVDNVILNKAIQLQSSRIIQNNENSSWLWISKNNLNINSISDRMYFLGQ
jgi:hypothetical protein